jgi:hypothetical protein
MKTQLTLFDLPTTKTITNGETCRTCEHRQRWECNSKFFQYCGIRKSNRTSNNKLKIKCKDKACVLYKQEK